MKNPYPYFCLFASCLPVKGAAKSLIYDIERQEILEIDNLVFEVLTNNKGKTIEELKSYYNHEYDNGIDAFFSKFVDMELGFFTGIPENFPPIKLEWFSPYKVINAILELCTNNYYDINSVLTELDKLGCQAVQIRFLDKISLNEITYILSNLVDTKIRGIEIIIKYENNDVNFFHALDKIAKKNSRVTKIIIHSYQREFKLNTHTFKSNKIIITDKVIKKNSAEIIKIENFTLSIVIFSEAQFHNIALNRKIYIDNYGYIKNYGTHNEVFGNVNKDKLSTIISKTEFQKKWYINNDKIEKCKDCQFRYMCLSNSDIIEKNQKFYKKEDCGFNPYKNEWLDKKPYSIYPSSSLNT